MKQYCQYCAFCFEADDFRCSNHPKGLERHWTEKDIKRENHCPNFALSDMGSVITGKQYKPREKIECKELPQMRLVDEEDAKEIANVIEFRRRMKRD